MIDIPRTARDRALILERCVSDVKFRKQVLERCSAPGPDACIFWVNTFVWSLDPRPDAPSPETPFILYPFQEDLIRRFDAAVEELDDLWVDKSRDMGATWTFCAWALHGWIFRSGRHGLLGSNKEAKVDNRTPDSHFGKLDFIIDRLPAWFMRDALAGFSKKKHRNKLKLINPSKSYPGAYGNTLLGESSNPNFGRGDRKTWAYIDEGATFERFAEAWMALAQSTRTRITQSTPFGMNSWGRMVHLPENAHRRITLHWRLHPLHDDEWYRRECARIVIPAHIAQELDLDYRGSSGGLVYPSWADCDFGVFDYDPDQPLYVTWDAGLDMTALIWFQRHPKTGVVTLIDCYQAKDKAISWFVPFTGGGLQIDSGLAKRYSPEEWARITIHSTWKPTIHYGDPSLRQRDVGTGQSPADVLRTFGIYVHTPTVNDFLSRRKAVLEGLRGLRVNLPGLDSPIGCHELDAAMRDARLQTRSEDSQATSEPNPIHDDTSHFRSSLEYGFMCLPRLAVRPRPESYRQPAAYDAFNRPKTGLHRLLKAAAA